MIRLRKVIIENDYRDSSLTLGGGKYFDTLSIVHGP